MLNPKNLFLVLLVGIFFSANASASLLITPTRIVFTERDRVQDVILVNTSTDTRSYTVQWVEMTQNKFGKYTVLSETDALSFDRASEFLRFSPRRVTLGPGENQKIKVVMRRNSSMTKPEYRSHLKFTALPPNKESTEEDSGNGIQIKVDVLINYSIPAIIRTELQKFDDIRFTNISLNTSDPDAPAVDVTLEKTFKQSALGRFEVHYKPNNSGEYEIVGRLNGVNYLHETNILERKIDLDNDVEISSGQIKVVYQSETNKSDQVSEIISI